MVKNFQFLYEYEHMLPFFEGFSTEFYRELDESSTHTYNKFYFIFKTPFNSILQSRPRASKWYLPFRFHTTVLSACVYSLVLHVPPIFIYCRHFNASILVSDVSNIYVGLFLLGFETRTCILHFLKMPCIGWWWGR